MGKNLTSRRQRKRSPEISRGTVLAIPLKVGEWALGQVIEPGINFFIGIVLERFFEPLAACDIKDHRLQLFGWTNDAEVYNGFWKNLGVYEIQNYGKLPNYKLGVEGDLRVESFDMKYVRAYDEENDRNLTYRTIHSPLSLQKEICAAFGII